MGKKKSKFKLYIILGSFLIVTFAVVYKILEPTKEEILTNLRSEITKGKFEAVQAKLANLNILKEGSWTERERLALLVYKLRARVATFSQSNLSANISSLTEVKKIKNEIAVASSFIGGVNQLDQIELRQILNDASTELSALEFEIQKQASQFMSGIQDHIRNNTARSEKK